MFPKDTATVMGKHATELEPKDLASIGFRMIASSELLFRPNMLENAYSAMDENRDPTDLVVAEGAQNQVDEQWAGFDNSDV